MTTSQTLLAGRYRLHETLGQGGMGRVWLATDELLHRQVAVKEVVLPAGLTPDEVRETGARASREARAAARLSHPNVVIVYDIVATDTMPWIVMEYLPSRSLDQKVVQDGPMTPQVAARVGLYVLTAMRAAHDVGVLHRDIKPSNVLLTDSGRVVLTDFGLATIVGDPAVTRTGTIFGSPSYMAPERARDAVANEASDLWSLGATLYFAVEGRSPYQRGSAMATVAALATEQPDPATRAGVLRPVLDGLLRRDPQDRLTAAQAERLLRDMAAQPAGAVAGAAAESEPGQPAVVPQQPAATPVETRVMPAAARPDATAGTQPAVQPLGAPAQQTTPGRGEPVGRAAPATQLVADPGEQRIGSPGNRRQTVIVASVAVLLLVVVAGWALTRGARNQGAAGRQPPVVQASSQAPARSSPAPSSASSAAAPSPAADQLPAGWHIYTDQTGFSLAVPADWRVSREGDMVYFRDGRGRVLGIGQTNKPKPDPVADWTSQEGRRVAAGNFPNYQRIRIEKVDYFLNAADWEFTYSGNSGGRTHANNRGFVTSPTRAYGMWWSTPDNRWDEYLPDLRRIQASFVPAG